MATASPSSTTRYVAPTRFSNAFLNALLPTHGEPRVMQRTSAVANLPAAQHAPSVASAPPTPKPVQVMRRGI